MTRLILQFYLLYLVSFNNRNYHQENFCHYFQQIMSSSAHVINDQSHCCNDKTILFLHVNKVKRVVN